MTNSANESLREVMALSEKAFDWPPSNLDGFASDAVEFFRQHGQHFAGLESTLQEWIDTADGLAAEVKRLRGSVSGWKSRFEQWQEAAEAAEARCAELEERNEYLANELHLARSHVTGWKSRCQQWQEQAESDRARVREAEGLLRETLPCLAEVDCVAMQSHPDGIFAAEALEKRIAAFLAARG